MPTNRPAFTPFLVSGTNQKRKSAEPDSCISANPQARKSETVLRRIYGILQRRLSGMPTFRICANLRSRIYGSAVLLFCAFLVSPAYASGSSMPWEAPLQKILESIEGPVAKIVAVIIIIVTGLTLAFGDAGGGFRKLIQIVFGLSIAFAASSFFLSFFSFGGGALI